MTSSFSFDNLCNAARSGISARDPELWSFAASLRYSALNCQLYMDQLTAIKRDLSNVFEELIARSDLPSFFKPSLILLPESKDLPGVRVKGEMATLQKNVFLNLVLILNPEHKLWVKRIDGEIRHSYLDTNRKDVFLEKDDFQLMHDLFWRAIHIYKDTFFGTIDAIEPNLTTVRFQLPPCGNGLRFQFNFSLALQAIGGTHRLIKQNQLVGGLNETLLRYEHAFLDIHGFRDMVWVLKLIHQKSNLHQIPSYTFETALTTVLLEKREFRTQWWNTSTFKQILDAALGVIRSRLFTEEILPSPIGGVNDILEPIREQSEELGAWITSWQAIPEAELCTELIRCQC